MIISIVFAMFTAGVVNAGGYFDCASRLADRYGTENSEALYGHATELRTLRAEPGSMADRDPELLRDIARISRSLEKGPSVDRLIAIAWEFDHILRTHDDPRLEGPVRVLRRAVVKLRDVLERSPPEFVSPLKEWSCLKSHMVELLVATMIAGEVIHLNPFITDLHPELIDRQGDREIDIIAVSADGTERWIEVKSWERFDEGCHRSRDALCKQAEATGALRDHLGERRIYRELVMRKSVPPAHLRRILEQTGYYRIDFIYLDAPDGLTPYQWE